MGESAKAAAKTPAKNPENRASQKKTEVSQVTDSPAEQILFLQRTIGNRAVERLIRSNGLQTKLRIGQPGDKYEQEADRVAEQVMRMPDGPKSTISGRNSYNSVQRQCPRCITKPHREEEEILQTKEAEFQTPEITPEFERDIDHIRGGGYPLPESLNASMEKHFDTDFSKVRVHSDVRATYLAKSINANAFTVGHDIVFGPGQYAPMSESGKRLLAHELTHVVQQDPMSIRFQKDPAKTGQKIEENSGYKLPKGINYEIRGAIVILRTGWLEEDSSWDPTNTSIQENAKIPELLRAFRQVGTLYWITDQQIAQVSPELGIEGPGKDAEVFGATLGLSAYQHIGPPPDTDVYWMRHGDGLAIMISRKSIEVGLTQPKGPIKISPQLKGRLWDELEKFTGLKILPAIRVEMDKAEISLSNIGKAAYVEIFSSASCERWFGKKEWKAYLAGTKEEPEGSRRGGKRYTESVTEEDWRWFEDWCKANLGPPKDIAGDVVVTRALIDTMRKVQGHPLRDQIIAALTRQGERGSEKKPLTVFLIESIIAKVEADNTRQGLGLEPQKKGDEKPLFDEPVRGRIVSPQLLYPGREGLFYFKQESNRDAFKVPWVNTEWVVREQGEGEKVLNHKRIHYGELKGPEPFKYTFQHTGHFLIYVFVFHNFYQPAHFQEPVEVKSESERLSEVENTAYGGFGIVTKDDKLKSKHDFETSSFNEAFGKTKYDTGVKVIGNLPPDFKSRSLEDRIKFLTDERIRVTKLRNDYSELKGPSAKDVIEYAEKYLDNIDKLEKKLHEEKGAGFVFIEARGAFLSRKHGIPDKALDLMAAVLKEETGTITVKIHDFTHLYEPENYHFSASGENFDVAAERTFVDMCKSYPPGRMSMRMERFDPSATMPSKQFTHFELDSGTAWKDVKSTVWDPTVQIVVNLAATVTMIFVPVTAPVLFPILVAYNAFETIDNLAQLADKGNLRWDHVVKGVALIGMDLLPYVGQAKKFATVARTMRFVIDGVQIAGQYVILTSDAIGRLEKMRDDDISEIARLYAWVEEKKKFNPSHPELAQKQKELDEKIANTRKRGEEMFEDLAVNGAIMLVSPVVFNHLQKLTAKGDIDALIKEGLFVHKRGENPHYDPIYGRMIGDKNMVGPVEFEAMQKAYAIDMTQHHIDLAQGFGTPPEKITIKRTGREVAVMKGKEGAIEIQIPQNMKIADGVASAKTKGGVKSKEAQTPTTPGKEGQTPTTPGKEAQPKPKEIGKAEELLESAQITRKETDRMYAEELQKSNDADLAFEQAEKDLNIAKQSNKNEEIKKAQDLYNRALERRKTARNDLKAAKELNDQAKIEELRASAKLNQLRQKKIEDELNNLSKSINEKILEKVEPENRARGALAKYDLLREEGRRKFEYAKERTASRLRIDLRKATKGQLELIKTEISKSEDGKELERIQKEAYNKLKIAQQERKKVEKIDEELSSLRQDYNNKRIELNKEVKSQPIELLERNPDDIKVDPVAPPANATGKVGDSSNQLLQAEYDLKEASKQGARDVRVIQEQVNAIGERVGINKPDHQYTIGNQRYYIEYEHLNNPRGYEHARRILANDPNGIVIIKLVPDTPDFKPGDGVIEIRYP